MYALCAIMFALALVRIGCCPSAWAEPNPPAGADGARPMVEAQPLDFTVTDLVGKPVQLKDWRGHPVIVDFWATWCPPCRKEIPELNDTYRRYQHRGLIVLGVSLDSVQGDGIRAVKPFVSEYKIAYPVAMGDDAIADKLELSVVPTTLFVERDGRLMLRIEGASGPGDLSKAAEGLLQK